MITEITDLIQHAYDYDEISSHISPNCLKDIDFEWNKEENLRCPYAAEILNNDLVLTIADLNEPYEVFAYFFFKIRIAELGVKAYKLEKAILDSKMSDDFIQYSISSILHNLVNGNDIIKDRVIVKGNHPLTSYQFEQTQKKVIKEILDEFHLLKEGIIPKEMLEDLFRRINNKNK